MVGKKQTKVVFEERRFAHTSDEEKDSITKEVVKKSDDLWADRSSDAFLFLDSRKRWISGTKFRQRRMILVLSVELPNQMRFI